MSLSSLKTGLSKSISLYRNRQNKLISIKLLNKTQKLFLCESTSQYHNFQWLMSYRTTTSSIKSEESNIVKSPCEKVVIPSNVSLPEFVWEQGVKHHANKPALTDGISGKSYTYEEACDESKKFGIALDHLNFEKGDVVAFFMPNCPEYITCLLGSIGMGAIVTTINPNYTANEVYKQLEVSNSKLILTIPTLLPIVKEAVTKAKIDIEIIVFGSNDHSYISYENLLSQIENDKVKDYTFRSNTWNDVALLPHSSGTTGLPKGVMLTTRNLVSNICQNVYAKELNFIKVTTDSFQPKIIGVLPMFHIFGLMDTCLSTLRAGAHVMTIPKFEPQAFISTLDIFKPTFLHLVPPLVAFCANNEDVKPHHLESVENILVGGAPVGEALIESFHKKAPNVHFREGWGMTETSPSVCKTQDETFKPGSCGFLLPNTEAKIINMETGEALGPFKQGELCIRGPQVMKGYLNNPKATDETIKPGNWLHSGDIAYYDDTFRFYIVDRLKELIKVKGFQVAPAELEDLIRSHPNVLDVAVIGIADAMKGEVPLAFIVRKVGITENNMKEDIHTFVNQHVAEYKRLAGGIEFLDAIPKSASGKILRKDLKALFTKMNGK